MRTDRAPLVSLSNSKWRFHPGDDQAWASPDFDDSKWDLLKADAPWNTQGYPGLSGFAWYRFVIHVPAGAGALALRVPSFATNYEVFANGTQIGACGKVGAQPVAYRCRPQVLQLPAAIDGRPLVIAIRVWHWTGWSSYLGGGPLRAGSFGASGSILKENGDAERVRRLSQIATWILSLLYGVGAVTAFVLYFWRKSEKEYLWFALLVSFESIEFGWSFFLFTHTVPMLSTQFLNDMLNLAGWFAAIAFFAELLHAKREIFYRITLFALGALGVIDFAVFWNVWAANHVALSNIAESILLLFPSTWIVLVLYQRTRQRFLDAALLLFPVFVLYGSGLLSSVLVIATQLGLKAPSLESFHITESPFPIDLSQLASFLFLISMLAILINRFTRTRRVEERYASEFESARHVQEVLVPVEVGSVPGFTIEAEYRPARSVGGDFYQVLPGTDGGVLIVVGDVAGKGMPAAMLVAMIVGSIRTQAVFSMDPAEMLRSLNERLCGRSSGGFSTCLAAYISASGEMTVANGGHLSPYLNGSEMVLEAELPLGLQTGVDYAVARFSLQRGDRLTFVSDGIVEATNARRELFGFERTQAMSMRSATEIIHAAQAFGQEDDITVVTAAFGV